MNNADILDDLLGGVDETTQKTNYYVPRRPSNSRQTSEKNPKMRVASYSRSSTNSLDNRNAYSTSRDNSSQMKVLNSYDGPTTSTTAYAESNIPSTSISDFDRADNDFDEGSLDALLQSLESPNKPNQLSNPASIKSTTQFQNISPSSHQSMKANSPSPHIKTSLLEDTDSYDFPSPLSRMSSEVSSMSIVGKRTQPESSAPTFRAVSNISTLSSSGSAKGFADPDGDDEDPFAPSPKKGPGDRSFSSLRANANTNTNTNADTRSDMPYSSSSETKSSSQSQSRSSNVPAKIFRSVSVSAGSSGQKRCVRAVLSGPSSGRGLRSSAFSKCVCDNLRCLQCNFQVCCYLEASWDETVAEYMFFRNNTPNDPKLSTGLQVTSTASAYCCQCSWITVESDVQLVSGQTDQPQWVCAGH